MFSHLPPRNQYGLVGLGAIALVAFAYIGGQKLREPAPMTLQAMPAATTPAPRVAEPVTERPADAPTPPETVAPVEVVVHVAGAVKKAGVVHAKPGSRVEDAIRMAGGSKADADLERINLAARLEDGTQLFVPSREKAEPQPIAEAYRGGPEAEPRYSATPKPRATSPRATPTRPAGKVSLNTGTQAELETLPGVGPATARKILDYRRAHGGFGMVEELLEVSGIGPKKLEKMRGFLKL
jgi:competence protein ComEA